MAETKAKTLIERFGFKDGDLTTPEHDKILCWLLESKHINRILTNLGLLKFAPTYSLHTDDYGSRFRYLAEHECWDWKNHKCFEASACCDDYIEAKAATLNNWLLIQAAGTSVEPLIKIEYQVMDGHYNIGFIDLQVQYPQRLSAAKVSGAGCYFVYKPFEIIHSTYFFEIKPKVYSIGELIRQINFYRSHLDYITYNNYGNCHRERIDGGTWIVITNSIDVAPILALEHIFCHLPYFKESPEAK